ISPLRQMNATTANEDAHLYQPSPAIRFRVAGFALPATVPARANPPPGVIVDYSLKSEPNDAMELDVLDANGKLDRKPTSKQAEKSASPEEEECGISRPGEKLPAEEGLNRFV